MAKTDETPDELSRLRAHNADLLADLREAKAAAREAQAAQAQAEAARDEALQRYKHAALDVPVRNLIDHETFEGKGELFRELFSRSYTFALDDDARVVIHDRDGNPVEIKGNEGEAPRHAEFNRDDIMALIKTTDHADVLGSIYRGSRASGGGAGGGIRGGGVPAMSTSQRKEQEAPRFGLG